MSAFGDHTPKQDMLENLEDVKTHHNLSWFDFLAFLVEVFAYLVEQAKYETEKE